MPVRDKIPAIAPSKLQKVQRKQNEKSDMKNPTQVDERHRH
jgi:hypothetical protein